MDYCENRAMTAIPRFSVSYGNLPSSPTTPNNLYKQLSFTTADFDNGPYFDPTSGMCKPSAGLWLFSWSVFATSNAASAGNGVFVVKLVWGPPGKPKDCKATIGQPNSAFPGVAAVSGTCIWECDGEKTFWLESYMSSAYGTDAVGIDTNRAHTWFQGVCLGPV